jgi:hypothetical protein
MARDLFHPIVREVLLSDGWTITHDPYYVDVMGRSYEIDLAAEQLVGAEKGLEKIAVEVKSFLAPSFNYEFHTILGQYLNYQTFMGILEPERMLYLAVPHGVYELFFTDEATQLILTKFSVNVVIYDAEKKTVKQWIRN